MRWVSWSLRFLRRIVPHRGRVDLGYRGSGRWTRSVAWLTWLTWLTVIIIIVVITYHHTQYWLLSLVNLLTTAHLDHATLGSCVAVYIWYMDHAA